MNIEVPPECGRSSPPALALSSARTTVVPTATTRPPASRTRRTCATSAGPTLIHSLCMACWRRSSLRTGWKVPAPTCRVTWPKSTPRAQRVQQRIVEMQPGGGRGDRSGLAREHGLVALDVVAPRLAPDVGRQRQSPGLEQPGLERVVDFEPEVVEAALARDHHRGAPGVERDARAW